MVSLVLNFLCCAAKNVMNLWSAIGDACAVTAGCGNFWVLLAVRLVLPDFFFFFNFFTSGAVCVARARPCVRSMYIEMDPHGLCVMRSTYIDMDPCGLWK